MERARKISTTRRVGTPPDRKISTSKKASTVRKPNIIDLERRSNSPHSTIEEEPGGNNKVIKNRTEYGVRTCKISDHRQPNLIRDGTMESIKTRRTSEERRRKVSLLSRKDSNFSIISVEQSEEDQKREIEKLLENGADSSGGEVSNSVWRGLDRWSGPTYRVLTGKLEDIPPLSSKVVRIFTSSTFTDTTVERNALMEKVYPQLKDYCRDKHGLEFQIVDMRWGVRDEMTDDHKTTEICLKEIENCQRISLGPNFVLFLGHKYGYRPLIRCIPASQFELMLDYALDDERVLLDTWYTRNENVIPPVYVLQPISSVLPNINNKRFQSLQKKDQQAWNSASSRISSILRRAVAKMLEKGQIDHVTAQDYVISVTELEVTDGILEARDTAEHCLTFSRTLKDADFAKMQKNWKYIDTDDYGQINKEAQDLLAKLRDEKLPGKLCPENILHYEIDCHWKRNITMKEQPEYIGEFCNDFRNKIIGLIELAVRKQNDLSAATYRETLQHLHACANFCQRFQGRDEIVDRIRSYIISDNTAPLVLYGESGCGKTNLLAKCASLAVQWLDNPGASVIIRFSGTTPDSSSVRPLLRSICEQLCFLYDQPTTDIPTDLLSLQNYMKTLIGLSSKENPVVILVDSLDQLSGQDGAHQLAWLPGELPPHAKFIVSTLPRYYCLLATLKDKILNQENFIEVTQLGEDLSTNILESWLKSASRSITPEQWKIVNEAINKCTLPLFIRLVFEEICRWESYSLQEHTVLASNIEESIMSLFARIEKTHGETLVSHAFGYITASKSGLSEAELEDLLSLDDTVLNDVYQYHVPPIRRIPPLLWTRIRNDLPGYLVEREADGLTVINWVHRQFNDAARTRYFKNLNFQSQMHCNLADYFRGIWGGKPKPYKLTATQKRLENSKNDMGESDRKVPSQQLISYDEDGNIVRYNLRKLSELPYHLVKAHHFKALNDEVLFNFTWLNTKMSCMPLQATIADFEFALEIVDDKEIRMLVDALRLSSSILSANPDMLGPQIAGRLLPYYTRTTKIRSLIDQCDREGLHKNALMPSYQCLHVPGGPLQYSFEGHTLSCYGLTVTSDDRYLVSVSNRMIIWDLHNGTVFRVIDPEIKSVMQMLVLDPDDRFAIAQTRGTNQIVLFSLICGDARVMDSPCENTDDPIIGVNIISDYFCVWSNTEWYFMSVNAALDARVHKSGTSTPEEPIIHIELRSEKEIFIIKGRDGGHTIEEVSENRSLEFNQALVMTPKADILYTTVAETKHDVVMFEKAAGEWKLVRTVAKNTDSVYSLSLSPNSALLIATVQGGFKVWSLKDDKTYTFNYPHGHRNFPTKNYSKSLVTFSKDNKFLVSASKKKLFVWKLQDPNPIRELDDHFERIVCLLSRSSWCTDFVLTSSLDQSVKVWNMKNILESSNPIARMDRPIEQIAMAEDTYIAATVTRNVLGIWDLENGGILHQLNYNGKGVGMVTEAAITSDGKYCISCENGKSGHVITWDLSSGEAVHVVEGRPDVFHIILNENETKAITFHKVPGQSVIKCVCEEIPTGRFVFEMSYPFVAPAKKPILTSDGLYILALSTTKSGQPCLKKFHSKTGVLLDSGVVRYPGFQPITNLVSMNGEEDQVVFIDKHKGNIWNMTKKELVESIPDWDGLSTQCGRYGVYAPEIGGVYMLDLTDGGKIAKVFHQRTNEGAHTTKTAFTSNDNYLLYYHSGHRSVRLFKVWGRRRVALNGQCIANYKLSADLRVMQSTHGGGYVVLGCSDGTVTTLTIAAPKDGDGGNDLLTSVRRRFYEAEFVFDESFKPVLKADLLDFGDVVSEVLKVKNEGTERADTIEEWIAEQKQKLQLEETSSSLHKFVNSVRPAVETAEVGEDSVDGSVQEEVPETNPDCELKEETVKTVEEEITDKKSQETDDNMNVADSAPDVVDDNADEEDAEVKGRVTTRRESSFDGVKRLDPAASGRAMNWSFAVMGVVVNDVAMGPAREEMLRQKALAKANGTEKPSLGLGGAMEVARVVGKTRRWKAERKAAKQAENPSGEKRNQRSVACTIS